MEAIQATLARFDGAGVHAPSNPTIVRLDENGKVQTAFVRTGRQRMFHQECLKLLAPFIEGRRHESKCIPLFVSTSKQEKEDAIAMLAVALMAHVPDLRMLHLTVYPERMTGLCHDMAQALDPSFKPDLDNLSAVGIQGRKIYAMRPRLDPNLRGVSANVLAIHDIDQVDTAVLKRVMIPLHLANCHVLTTTSWVTDGETLAKMVYSRVMVVHPPPPPPPTTPPPTTPPPTEATSE
jgi:hypothetical protein